MYLTRWQLSTPILAVCVVYFARFGSVGSTVIANLIGGLIFFWVDRIIFTAKVGEPLWAIREEVRCVDCGQIARGFRLVAARNYDRTRDTRPEFRCEGCSKSKLIDLRGRGIVLE